jgi:hypothetical protein
MESSRLLYLGRVWPLTVTARGYIGSRAVVVVIREVVVVDQDKVLVVWDVDGTFVRVVMARQETMVYTGTIPIRSRCQFGVF